MKYLFLFVALLWAFLAGAQTQPPIVQGAKLYQFKNGTKHDSALFLPRRDTLHTDSAMIAPGQLMYRLMDSLLYWRKGDKMTPIASGVAAVNIYAKNGLRREGDTIKFGNVYSDPNGAAVQVDSIVYNQNGKIFNWITGTNATLRISKNALSKPDPDHTTENYSPIELVNEQNALILEMHGTTNTLGPSNGVTGGFKFHDFRRFFGKGTNNVTFLPSDSPQIYWRNDVNFKSGNGSIDTAYGTFVRIYVSGQQDGTNLNGFQPLVLQGAKSQFVPADSSITFPLYPTAVMKKTTVGFDRTTGGIPGVNDVNGYIDTTLSRLSINADNKPIKIYQLPQVLSDVNSAFLSYDGGGAHNKGKVEWMNIGGVAMVVRDIVDSLGGPLNARSIVTHNVLYRPGMSLFAFGDSFTNPGSNATNANRAYINITRNTLNPTDFQNYAVSGQGVWRMASNGFQYLPQTGSDVFVTAMAGYNDIRQRGGNAFTFSKISMCYRSFLANQFLGTAVTANSPAITTTGTWTKTYNTNVPGGKAGRMGGFGAFTPTPGATAQWSFTGNTLVVGMIGTDGTASHSDSFRIQIDAVDYGWYNFNAVFDNLNPTGPASVVLRNIGTGAHTVTITKGGNASYNLILDYLGTLNAPEKCAPVVIGSIARMLDSNYRYAKATYNATIGDTTVDRANFLIRDVIKEFQGYPVTFADINNFFKIYGGTSVDSIHPNDIGHTQLAQGFMSVISPTDTIVDWDNIASVPDFATKDYTDSLLDLRSFKMAKQIALNMDSAILFADSYGVGVGASQTWRSWANTYKTTMNIGLNNQSISGIGAARVQRLSYQALPTLDNSAPLLSMIGLNDLWRNNGQFPTIAKIFHCYRMFLLNNFLDTAIPADDAAIGTSGTWTTQRTDSLGGKATSLGGLGRSTTQVGAGLSYTFSGTNLVVGAIGVDGIVKQTLPFSVDIDGVGYGTFDFNNVTDGVNDATLNNRSIGAGTFVINLPEGAHTVSIVAQAGTGTLVIDYLGTLKPPEDCTPVYVGEIARLSQSGYAYLQTTYGSTLNDSIINLANYWIRRCMHDFTGYPVALAQTSAFFDPENDIVTPNDIHPNDAGHRDISRAFANASYKVIATAPPTYDWNDVMVNGNSTDKVARITNTNSTPVTGVGLELSYNTGLERGFVFPYDRTGAAYKELTLRGSKVDIDVGNLIVGGTTDGGEKLQVLGTSRFDALLTANSGTGVGTLHQRIGSTTGTRWEFVNAGAASDRMQLRSYNSVNTEAYRFDPNGNSFVNVVGGNFGIGDNNPTAGKLSVAGTIAATGITLSTTTQNMYAPAFSSKTAVTSSIYTIGTAGTTYMGMGMGGGNTATTIAVGMNGSNAVTGGGAFTEAASGTHDIIAGHSFKPPLITNGVATTTNAPTLMVDGVSAQGVNNYAIWVRAGNSLFNGNITSSSTTTSLHYAGNSGTPTFTPNGNTTSILGTGYSVNITGNDAFLKVEIITGTGMTTSGTIGTITFNTAYASTPVAVWSPSDVTTLSNNIVGFSATATTGVLVFSTVNIAPSTTYNYSIHVGN